MEKEKNQRQPGFTMIEIMLVISILTTMALITVLPMTGFLNRSKINNEVDRILSTLMLARAKTLASENDEVWGVYFSSLSPQSYTLFLGQDYSSRQIAYDEVTELPNGVEFSDLDLGAGQYVVFERLTGFSNLNGSTTLALVSDSSISASIYIKDNGYIGTSDQALPDETGLARDTRRVRFAFSSSISSSTDSLVLSFDSGSVIETLALKDYMTSQDEFNWEGSVDVGGEIQELRIHTIDLNTANRAFCVHRDAGSNTKSLDIDLLSDLAMSPNLIHLPADSSGATKGNSIFVGDPVLH